MLGILFCPQYASVSIVTTKKIKGRKKRKVEAEGADPGNIKMEEDNACGFIEKLRSNRCQFYLNFTN